MRKVVSDLGDHLQRAPKISCEPKSNSKRNSLPQLKPRIVESFWLGKSETTEFDQFVLYVDRSFNNEMERINAPHLVEKSEVTLVDRRNGSLHSTNAATTASEEQSEGPRIAPEAPIQKKIDRIAASPKRQTATSTFTLMVTVVRFHMGVTPFLDHAGAAHKGCG